MPTPQKSPEMHRLTGSKSQAKNPADRSLIAAGRPKIPSHLTRPERAQYKRLVAALELRGHATPGDYDLLAVLATATVRWISEKQDLADRGPWIEIQVPDGSGTGGTITREIENPSRKNSLESEKQIAALLKELGLTPRQRDSVKKATTGREAEPVDEAEEFLAQNVTVFPGSGQ
jgi:P27 family predicted phage terminase small subunit